MFYTRLTERRSAFKHLLIDLQRWTLRRWCAHAEVDISHVDLHQTQKAASLRTPTLCCVLFSMDQSASSCMRSPHTGSALWGCVRSPHSGGSGAGLQPYQQAPFALHQKHDFLAYTDFSLVPAPHAYPREDRLYPEAHGGYHRTEWQFSPCEPRGRGQEPCQGAAEAVGAELDSAGGDRLPGAVTACLEGEYSPQSVPAVDTEKKSSKRKREITGESFRQEWMRYEAMAGVIHSESCELSHLLPAQKL